jgi:hypothetical protein
VGNLEFAKMMLLAVPLGFLMLAVICGVPLMIVSLLVSGASFPWLPP